MSENIGIKDIIQQIKSGKLSPEEAVKVYKMNQKKVTDMVSYYKYEWLPKQLQKVNVGKTPFRNILVFGKNTAIIEELRQQNSVVITVEMGSQYAYDGEQGYVINPADKKDYEQLFSSLLKKDFYPEVILHLFGLGDEVDHLVKCFEEQIASANADACKTARRLMEMSVDSLFYIIQLMPREWDGAIRKFIYAYFEKQNTNNPFAAAACAFIKSAKNVMPDMSFVSVKLSEQKEQLQIINEFVADETKPYEVSYRQNQRFCRELFPYKKEGNNSFKTQSRIQLKKNGTYIIFGGKGALGQIVSEYIVNHYDAKIIMVGRRQLTKEAEAQIQIKKNGEEYIKYYSCDICDYDGVKKIFDKILTENKHIDGLFHMAGMTSNNLVTDKGYQEFQEIIKAKIYGTIILDELSAKMDMDFFFMFSSLSSILGDFGQCDYATGNSFLDAYSDMRERMRSKDLRNAKTIVVNWPLWKEGAMHFSEEGEKLYLKSNGMTYLGKEDGINALEEILHQEDTQIIVIAKEKETMKQKLKELHTLVENDIIIFAAETLKSDIKDININIGFGEFGFDSIMMKEFVHKINCLFKINLKVTILFSQNNIKMLSEYLIREYEKELSEYYLKNEEQRKEDTESSKNGENREVCREDCGQDIAIIGMDARFPGADNTEAFWDILKNQRSAITEVPEERWDMDKFYSPIPGDKNKSISKWGGFLRDVDKFDAKFFGIVPREAELMDPQQRLLIETVWNAFEDAGYRISSFAKKEIGVFIGMQFGEYEDLIKKFTDDVMPQITTGVALNMLSNRISYLFDFCGPSMCIDTACSSSLVAIHNAIKAIRSHECEMAVAGGVSLMLSEDHFIAASQMGLQAPDGKCKTFDKKANGYVKGEGVGAVLLKSLDEAIKDHDHIYGVIKGSWVNHGGRASSITAPNSDAQAKLIVKAFQNANFRPETVSYIEAHGTGTELGDSVEMEGIKKAFSVMYHSRGTEMPKTKICGIGSVKTNIGHLEPASGMAGLIKILLAFKHKEIPGLVNFTEQNPYIEIENTPFYFVDQTKKWEQQIDENKVIIPRRAGISAFGFGGTNAHLLLEEYNNTKRQNDGKKEYILPLSAKSKVQLIKSAERFIGFLEKESADDALASMEDIAYTLQTGREPMEERVAFIASSAEEWKKQLKEFVKTNEENDKIFTRTVNAEYTVVEEKINTLISEGKYRELARLWVDGADIPWEKCVCDSLPYRVSLPLYVFDRKRYWFDMYLKGTKDKNEIYNIKNIEQINTETVPDMKEIYEQWEETARNDEGNVVDYEVLESGIALITMRDIQNRNMFSDQLTSGLIKAFMKVKNDNEVKVVVLTGSDKLFCMGGMEETLQNITEQKEKCSDGTFVYYGMLECDVPVISAMQGHAFGGGFVFGLFADIVVMAKEGIYSCNFTKYGFTPGVGATYILKEKLGNNLATEMMFSARDYLGEELERRGVSFLFREKSKVLEEALNLAGQLAEKPLCTLKVLKKELSHRVLKQLPEIIQSEVKMQEDIFSQPNVGAFQKRIKQIFHKEEINNISTAQSTSEPHASKKISLKKVDDNEKSEDVELILADILSGILQIPKEEINRDCSFRELGIDSITGIEFVRAMNLRLNLKLAVTDIYDYTTISKLSEYLEKIVNKDANRVADKDTNRKPVLQLRDTKRKMSMPADNGVSQENTEQQLKIIVGEILQENIKEISEEANFSNLGIDSISAVELVREINKKFGINIEAIDIYDHTCIKEMATFIETKIVGNKSLKTYKLKKLAQDSEEKEKTVLQENEAVMKILKKLSDGETSIEDVEEYLEANICETKK